MTPRSNRCAGQKPHRRDLRDPPMRGGGSWACTGDRGGSGSPRPTSGATKSFDGPTLTRGGGRPAPGAGSVRAVGRPGGKTEGRRGSRIDPEEGGRYLGITQN